MDAATLYAVMSVASGPKRMTTQKYPTMAICEEVAGKMRKRASMRTATFYCVKRKPDASERTAATAAARKRAAQRSSPQGQAQAQAQPPAPVGMPRDFFSGTSAPLQ